MWESYRLNSTLWHSGLLQALLLVVICLGGLTFGADIYVSPIGSDTASGLSPAEPVQTINQATSLVTAGATVFLMPDAGSHDFGASQQLSKSISIQSAPGNSYATITTSTMTSGSLFTVSGGITVSLSNLVFDVSARNLPGLFVLSSMAGSNIMFENVMIRCMRVQDSCFPLYINGGNIQGTNVTIDGGGTSTLLGLAAGSAFRDSLFSFASGVNYGPFLFSSVSNDFLFDNCVVSHSKAGTLGGVRVETNSRIIFRNSACFFSEAPTGSCISLGGSSYVLVQNSSFTDNCASAPSTAGSFGGPAVRLNGASTGEIRDSYFARNFAQGRGGAVSSQGTSTLRIWSSIFEDNAARDGAGVLLCSAGIVSVLDSHFRGNGYIGNSSVVAYGSVAWIAPSVATFVETTFSGCTFESNYAGNAAGTPGGALCLFSRSVTIENNYFFNNTAFLGGAALILHALNPVIRNNTFYKNQATRGGAIELQWSQYVPGYPVTTIVDNRFVENVATSPLPVPVGAAALGMLGGEQVTISGNLFLNNSAIRTHALSPYLSGGAVDIIGYLNVTYFVSNNSFVGNSLIAKVGNLSIGSAFRLGGESPIGGPAPTVVCEIVDCLFEENKIIEDDLLSMPQGGALGAELVSSASVLLNVSRCIFRRNSARSGGAMFLSNVDFRLQDSIFEDNFGGVSIGGVRAIVQEILLPRVVEAVISNCTFRGNRAQPGPTDLEMVDFAFTAIPCTSPTTTFRVTVDNLCTFSDLPPRPTFFYGNFFVDGCIELSFVPATSLSKPVIEAPNVWIVGCAIANATVAEISFDALRLWRGTETTRPTQLLLGEYDALLLEGEHYLDDGIVSSTDGGRLRTKGSLVAVNPTVKLLRNLDVIVEASGTMTVYPTTLEMDNSSIIIEQDAILWFPVFRAPATVQRGNASSSSEPSQIVIRGNLQEVSALLSGIDLIVAPSGKVMHLIHNSAEPAWIDFRNDSTATFSGTLEVDFANAVLRRLPKFGQEFMLTHNIKFPSVTPDEVIFSSGYSGVYYTRGNDSFANVTAMTPMSASINDAGSQIRFVFPEPTNIPSSRRCVPVLTAQTIAELDIESECAWASPTEFVIHSTIVPSSIEFEPGVVYSARDSRLVAVIPPGFLITPPAHPLFPEVVLVAPSISPHCYATTLDASASFNLAHAADAQFHWALEVSTASNVASLKSFLQGLLPNTSRVEIPANLFEADKDYTFSVNITNSFGLSTTATTLIQRSSQGMLAVFIEGPQNRTADSQTALYLHGRVEVLCNSDTVASVTRQWQQLSGPALNVGPAAFDDFLLEIPTNALSPGALYTFEFAAWPSDAPALRSTGQIQVACVWAPPTIALNGSSGLVSSLSDITIGAELVGADSINASPSEFEWQWSAQNCPGKSNDGRISSLVLAEAYLRENSVLGSSSNLIRLPDQGAYCLNATGQKVLFRPPIALGRTTSILIPAGTFADGEVLLGLTVRNRLDGLSSSRLIWLNFTSVVPPSSLVTVSIDVPSRQGVKILAQEKLVLRSAISNSGGSLLWEHSDSAVFSSSNLLTSTTGPDMVVRADAVTPGHLYELTLRYSSGSTGGGGKIGAAKEFLLANNAPASGSLRVDSTQPLTQFQRFRVSAPGWIDDQLPLQYLFSLIPASQGGSEEIFLTELIQVPSATVICPVEGDITLKVRVFDSQGAMSVSLLPDVHIIASGDGLAAQSLEKEFDQYVNWGDSRSAIQVAMTLLHSKNAINDTASSLRQRVLAELTSLVSRRASSAWINSPSVINLLELVTDSIALDPAAMENCTLILERIVTEAVQNTKIGGALSFSSSELARFSVVGFLRSGIRVARTVLAQSAAPLSIRQRLQAVVESLVLLQSRFKVADEFAEEIVAESLRAVSVLLSSDSVAATSGQITVGGVNMTFLNQFSTNSSNVGVSVIRWSGESFPIGGNSGRPVVQVLYSGGAATTISTDFSGINDGVCASLDQVSGVWDSSQCTTTTTTTTYGGGVRCECASSPGGRLAVSLLFGTTTTTPTTTEPNSYSPTTAAPSTGESASIAGPVAGAVVAVVVVIIIVAILIAVFVPSVRDKIAPFRRRQKQLQQEDSTSSSSLMGEELTSVRNTQSQWTRASKPSTATTTD